MERVDLRKDLRHLYEPSPREVVQVEVPTMRFVMLDGQGDPNGSDSYQAAVEALFGLSYALKFMVKKGALATDYSVMPLEGLWWADDMSRFSVEDKSNWKWTMMVMQPDLVTPTMVAGAVQGLQKKTSAAVLERVRFEPFSEALCAQIMHLGPFSAEGPTIERLHRFIANAGRKPVGRHHEIYLSDIRKAAPAKWRTVIRQPME